MKSRAVTCAVVGVASVLLVAQRPVPDVVPTREGDVTIVPVTHGTIEILFGSHAILVDPARFTPGAPLPFTPPLPGGRLTLPPGVKPEDSISTWPVTAGQLSRFTNLKPPTLILVTDDHDDHFDAPAIERLRSATTTVVGPAVISTRMKGVVPMANGEQKTVAGVTLEAVPMYNLKPEPGFTDVFHTKGRGNGYIVTLGGLRVYIAGDTACTSEMRALRSIDIAFLPMNLPFTMSPIDAAECAQAFKPRIVYPYHYFGADVATFARVLGPTSIEVRLRDWYLGVTPAKTGLRE